MSPKDELVLDSLLILSANEFRSSQYLRVILGFKSMETGSTKYLNVLVVTILSMLTSSYERFVKLTSRFQSGEGWQVHLGRA